MIVLVARGDRIDRKGTWSPLHDGGKALVCCPRCRWVGSLAHYSVSDTGAVAPAYVCMGKGCSWFEFIGLEGWDGW